MKRETLDLLKKLADGGDMLSDEKAKELIYFMCEALAAAHTHDARTGAVVPLLTEE